MSSIMGEKTFFMKGMVQFLVSINDLRQGAVVTNFFHKFLELVDVFTSGIIKFIFVFL